MQHNQDHSQSTRPPGLKLATDAITPAQEEALIGLIDSSGLVGLAYDPGNPRASKTFGWLYHFADDSISWGEPLPPSFDAIRDIAAACAGIAPERLVECMLIRYEPGSIIQPHLDRPAWDHIIGVSLGSAVTMHFDRDDAGADSYDVALPPRSLYVLTGAARDTYRHSLPTISARRWSITFRSFSAVGERMRAALESCDAR